MSSVNLIEGQVYAASLSLSHSNLTEVIGLSLVQMFIGFSD